jgi:hypothetical protein
MQKIKDLDELLNSSDVKNSIGEISFFVCKVCNYGNNFEEVTEPQKHLYLNRWFENQINNGGFWQYFFNSSSNVAHQTVDSLRIIGANTTADMLQKAIDQFPDKTIPNTYEERMEIFEQIGDSEYEVWKELTKKFYEYPDDLQTLNLEYIKQNRDMF